MSWSPAELTTLNDRDELRIASYRPDGTLRPLIPIWMVVVGDEVLVRSAYGPDNGWFRRAKASGTGHIASASVDRDVRFVAPTATDAEVDEAYRAKYGRRYASITDGMVGPAMAGLTLALAAD